jgi:hypothetical protein
MAAGYCRLQLRDQVFDLDEPAMVDAGEAKDLPWPVRRAISALGFKYLNLRTLAPSPGTATHVVGEATRPGQPGPMQQSAVARDEALLIRQRMRRAAA